MKKMLAALALASVLLLSACGGAAGAEERLGPGRAWTDGTVANGVYRNEYLGLTFHLPEDFVQAGEAEKNAILNAGGGAVCDVLLGREDHSAMVYVMCVGLDAVPGGADLSGGDYLAETLRSISARLDGTETAPPAVFALCGADWLRGTLRMSGGPVQHILMRKTDAARLAMVGVQAPSEAEADYLLARFAADPGALPAPAPPPVSEPPARSGAADPGAVSDGVYVIAALGMRAVLPEGWSADSTDSTDSGGAVFQAVSPTGLSLVQVAVRDLSALPGGEEIDEDPFAALLLAELEADPAFSGAELRRGVLAGRECPVAHGEDAALLMDRDVYVLRAEGSMYLILLLSAEGTAEELPGMFEALPESEK